MYFLLALLFARHSPFYLYLFLFSLAFLSPCSAYFGDLSNFPVLFLNSLYAFYFLFSFGRSVFFFSAYFHSKPSLYKALALLVLLLCELIRNYRIMRITVQLQPHQLDFQLKTRVANYLLTQLHIRITQGLHVG